MAECYWCDKDMPDSRNDAHEVCEGEWRRRRNAGTCVECGKRGSMWPDSTLCNECEYADNGPPYPGYPPGAAQ